MWIKLIIALGIASCLGFVSTQQQQQSQCTQAFNNGLYACIKSNHLEITEFLTLINDQDRAGKDEGEDPTRDVICRKEVDVVNCGMAFMNRIDNSKICGDDEWKTIRNEFMKIISQFDSICGHACRKTLPQNLHDCYKYNELDPYIFLSKAAMGRGAVIGDNEKDVTQYCKQRTLLISCMKLQRDNCPDSPVILRNMGIDIESMEKGTRVLCSNPKVYLNGLSCFKNPTDGVAKCQKRHNRQTVDLIMKAQNTSMNEDDFFREFCGIKVNQVDCEMIAWSQNLVCTEPMIGLRTELECVLMPDQCTTAYETDLKEVCFEDAFRRELRNSSVSMTTTSMSDSLTAMIIFVSYYLIKR